MGFELKNENGGIKTWEDDATHVKIEEQSATQSVVYMPPREGENFQQVVVEQRYDDQGNKSGAVVSFRGNDGNAIISAEYNANNQVVNFQTLAGSMDANLSEYRVSFQNENYTVKYNNDETVVITDSRGAVVLNTDRRYYDILNASLQVANVLRDNEPRFNTALTEAGQHLDALESQRQGNERDDFVPVNGDDVQELNDEAPQASQQGNAQQQGQPQAQQGDAQQQEEMAIANEPYRVDLADDGAYQYTHPDGNRVIYSPSADGQSIAQTEVYVPGENGYVVYTANNQIDQAVIARDDGSAGIVGYERVDSDNGPIYRPSSVTLGDIDQSGNMTQRGTVNYDAEGKLVSVVDANDNHFAVIGGSLRLVDAEGNLVLADGAEGVRANADLQNNATKLVYEAQWYTGARDNEGRSRANDLVNSANQVLQNQGEAVNAFDQSNAEAKLQQLRDRVSGQYTNEQIAALDYWASAMVNIRRSEAEDSGRTLNSTELAEIYIEEFRNKEHTLLDDDGNIKTKEMKEFVKGYKKARKKVEKLYRKAEKAQAKVDKRQSQLEAAQESGNQRKIARAQRRLAKAQADAQAREDTYNTHDPAMAMQLDAEREYLIRHSGDNAQEQSNSSAATREAMQDARQYADAMVNVAEGVASGGAGVIINAAQQGAQVAAGNQQGNGRQGQQDDMYEFQTRRGNVQGRSR